MCEFGKLLSELGFIIFNSLCKFIAFRLQLHKRQAAWSQTHCPCTPRGPRRRTTFLVASPPSRGSTLRFWLVAVPTSTPSLSVIFIFSLQPPQKFSSPDDLEDSQEMLSGQNSHFGSAAAFCAKVGPSFTGDNLYTCCRRTNQRKFSSLPSEPRAQQRFRAPKFQPPGKSLYR